MYANDVQLALNCDARGMDLVRATPILVPLKLQLRVFFLQMHRQWLYHTEWYQPRGPTCIPELSEVLRRHWASTTAETVFVELYFGVLRDTLKVSGPGVVVCFLKTLSYSCASCFAKSQIPNRQTSQDL